MIKERQKNPNSFISNRFLLFFNTFYAHLKQNSCMTFYVHVIVDFIEYMYSNVNTILAKAEEDIRFF